MFNCINVSANNIKTIKGIAMNNILPPILLSTLASLLLISCGGGGGGSSSSAQKPSSVTFARVIAPGAACPTGGIEVDSGINIYNFLK